MNPAPIISNLFEEFNQKRILIIGDVMTDAYYWGHVDRISPEAPVPIVLVEKKDKRPGGAANVALNIKSMGAHPILCTVIGNDQEGIEFKKILVNHAVSTDFCLALNGRSSTVKTRIIGNKHQLIRVDEEDQNDLSAEDEAIFLQHIQSCIENEKIDCIIFEDYNKGTLTPFIIENTIRLANQYNIITAVDPKKENFLLYKNVTLFKPNFHELKAGLKTDLDIHHIDQLCDQIDSFRNQMNIETILLTLSEHGVFFQNNVSQKIIPAHIRTISDVSGAGDTVISVAALCKACGITDELMAALSNLAGGLVCEKIGVVPVDKNQLMEEALKLNFDSIPTIR